MRHRDRSPDSPDAPIVQWLEYVVANDVAGVRFPVGANAVGWMAEWFKALVLGTSLCGGVGSNPTPVIFLPGV